MDLTTSLQAVAVPMISIAGVATEAFIWIATIIAFFLIDGVILFAVFRSRRRRSQRLLADLGGYDELYRHIQPAAYTPGYTINGQPAVAPTTTVAGMTPPVAPGAVAAPARPGLTPPPAAVPQAQYPHT